VRVATHLRFFPRRVLVALTRAGWQGAGFYGFGTSKWDASYLASLIAVYWKLAKLSLGAARQLARRSYRDGLK